MTRELVIDGHRINDESDCFVIAEVGHNHQGDMEKARELFRQAKDCGATAVKLQKRDNKSLYRRSMYDQPYDNENSFGPTYGQHREALEFGWSQYRELQDYARELGLTFFATAFDLPSADFLQELGVPVFKIASGDLRNIPLITHVARFGKPLIVSCGGGTLDDVRRVYDAVMPINRQLALLQCTCSYPCEFSELDLGVITTFRQTFPDVVIGYSGHDSGIAMALAAYVLGARIVEKHFTLNRAMKGTDHAFSLEPVGLKKMVRDLKRVRIAMGDGQKKVHASEAPAVRKMGKALVAARDLPAGHVLADGDVAIKSPADGLPPFELPRVLGRRLKQPLSADDFIVPDALG
jgi:N-acetylneuraminate synthase/sialic acid synthase